jgi:hypothetical protein
VPTSFAVVSGSYFAAMDVPILRGRPFTDEDARTAGAAPVVVSAALARRLWGAGESLGRHIRDADQEYYVVGVAGDVHNVSLAQRDGAFLYRPISPDDPRGAKLIVRERGDHPTIAGAVPSIVASVDGGVRVVTESFADRLARMLAPARTAAAICSAVGLLAALLALVGVYGVASYNASRRTREMAVRMALGATVRDVLALVIGEGAKPVLAGLVVGALFTAAAAQLLRGLLFGVSPLDPAALLGATALLAAASSLALYRPARRVTRMQPASALRDE